MNTFTLDRATEYARSIEAIGLRTDVRVVQINGAVGGRTHQPALFWGHAVRYMSGDNGECIAFWPASDFRDAYRSHYIVDGVGMYVAGWLSVGNGSADAAPDGWILLHPIDEYNVGMLPRRAYVLRTAGLS